MATPPAPTMAAVLARYSDETSRTLTEARPAADTAHARLLAATDRVRTINATARDAARRNATETLIAALKACDDAAEALMGTAMSAAEVCGREHGASETKRTLASLFTDLQRFIEADAAPLPLVANEECTTRLMKFGSARMHGPLGAPQEADVYREEWDLRENIKIFSKYGETRDSGSIDLVVVDARDPEQTFTAMMCAVWQRAPRSPAKYLLSLYFKNPKDKGPKGDCIACGHGCSGYRIQVARYNFHIACALFVVSTERTAPEAMGMV